MGHEQAVLISGEYLLLKALQQHLLPSYEHQWDLSLMPTPWHWWLQALCQHNRNHRSENALTSNSVPRLWMMCIQADYGQVYWKGKANDGGSWLNLHLISLHLITQFGKAGFQPIEIRLIFLEKILNSLTKISDQKQLNNTTPYAGDWKERK